MIGKFGLHFITKKDGFDLLIKNFVNLRENSYKIGFDVHRIFMNDTSDTNWYLSIKTRLNLLWYYRNNIIRQSIKLLDLFNITDSMINTLSHPFNSIVWFGAVGRNNYQSALDVINFIIRQMYDYLMGNEVNDNDFVDYQIFFEQNYFQFPPFLTSINEKELYNLLIDKDDNTEWASYQFIRLAEIGLKFIELYCDKYMDNNMNIKQYLNQL